MAEGVGGPGGGLHAHLHGHGDWRRRAASDFSLFSRIEARRLFARDEEAGRGFSAQLYLEAGSRTCAPPSGPAVDAVLEASGESHRVVLVRGR